jgi:protein-S-isoprenylcysteine O-methyltransferase Ste14
MPIDMTDIRQREFISAPGNSATTSPWTRFYMTIRASMPALGPAARERLKAIRQSKLYDLLAAAPLIAWFLFCAAQILPLVIRQIALVKLMIETDPSVMPASLVLSTLSRVTSLVFFAVLIVILVVRRVPQRTRLGFFPRCTAVAGTFVGVGIALLPPQELSPVAYLVSLLLIISGTVFAIYAAVALGRSMSILPEARRLVTWGPYALVRHPLYLGEIVAMAGVALQYRSPLAALLLGLLYVFQFLRMKNEERVLSQVFPEFGGYAARTARLVPGVY